MSPRVLIPRVDNHPLFIICLSLLLFLLFIFFFPFIKHQLFSLFSIRFQGILIQALITHPCIQNQRGFFTKTLKEDEQLSSIKHHPRDGGGISLGPPPTKKALSWAYITNDQAWMDGSVGRGNLPSPSVRPSDRLSVRRQRG